MVENTKNPAAINPITVVGIVGLLTMRLNLTNGAEYGMKRDFKGFRRRIQLAGQPVVPDTSGLRTAHTCKTTIEPSLTAESTHQEDRARMTFHCRTCPRC
jgi:hypothetical protein